MAVYSDEVTGLVQEYVEAQGELDHKVMHRKETLRHKKLYARQLDILKRISQLCPDESPMDVVKALSDVYD